MQKEENVISTIKGSLKEAKLPKKIIKQLKRHSENNLIPKNNKESIESGNNNSICNYVQYSDYNTI